MVSRFRDEVGLESPNCTDEPVSHDVEYSSRSMKSPNPGDALLSFLPWSNSAQFQPRRSVNKEKRAGTSVIQFIVFVLA